MLELTLTTLALETTTFQAGDTVRVTVSFRYKVGVDTSLKLLAAPYYSNLFGKNLVEQCQGQADLFLEDCSIEGEKTAAVDMVLVPKSLGGIDNGTYGLVVWLRPENSSAGPWTLPGPIARAEQDNVLVVSGNSGGGLMDSFSSMMPMLMMVMMLGMVMPLMQGLGGGEE
jgi:hypothetical protein